MNGDGSPAPASSRLGLRRLLWTGTAIALVTVAVSALAVQGVRANRTVDDQLGAATVRDAALDDSFYRCIDVQARSLVSPGQPVLLAGTTLEDDITLLKGIGSWVTIADPPSSAVLRLSLRDHVGGPGACLGMVVVARQAVPGHGVIVRVGTGASVAGHGPPPPPPL